MELILTGADESEVDENVAGDAGNDYSDDYGNDFEDKVEESDPAVEHPEPAQSQPQDQDPIIEDEQDPNDQIDEGEGLDQEIDDEEMISIAENCLIKIAEELLNKKMTVRMLFREEIIDEEIEGEKIELLLPLSFLEGLKNLGIEDFSEIEIA
jgi:hypothetical protein